MSAVMSAGERGVRLLIFDVPGDPVAKGRARARVINGRATLYTPRETVEYERHVAWCAKAALAGQAVPRAPMKVTLDIQLDVPKSWSGKRRAAALAGQIVPTSKPDASNVLKAVEDACNEIVYPDDSHIVSLVVDKRFAPAPGVTVTIEWLDKEMAT